MVNVNTYNNEEMVLIQFSGNIFLKIWIFSVVDHKYLTAAGLIDYFLAKSIIIKVQFCIRAQSKHVFYVIR